MTRFNLCTARLGKGIAVLLLSACAQAQIISTTSPAVWLEPHAEGIAFLQADGRVAYWNGDTTEVLASDIAGDSIISCGGFLFGVGSNGDLLNVTTSTRGLGVALHSRPACLETGLVALTEAATELVSLSYGVEVQARVSLNALPDAELVLAELTGDTRPELVVLTDPTRRYPHGVLGDDIEAASVSVFDALTLELITSYTLPEAFVFEQRRVLPFSWSGSVTTFDQQAAESPSPVAPYLRGIMATRSSQQAGAGVVLLAIREGKLELIAEAPAIGTGFRWLNLFAADLGYAYAVKTPHIGGPLERYSLETEGDGWTLKAAPFRLGVTNHSYGERNLDLALLISADLVRHTLAITLASHDGIRLVHCFKTCEAGETYLADARLSSNVTQFTRDATSYIAFADVGGKIYELPVK